VLYHFVRSVIRTTTNDPRLLSGFVILDRDGILADILEPDVFERAVALAVDTFGLVLSDDDVAECGTFLEEEDSVGGACQGVSIDCEVGERDGLNIPPSLWPEQAPLPRS
jgi:hypothetical protein